MIVAAGSTPCFPERLARLQWLKKKKKMKKRKKKKRETKVYMPSCHTANHVLLRCGFNKNTQFLSFSAKIKKEKKNLNKANFSSVKAFPFLFHLMMLNGEHGLLSCWCVSVALLQVASSFLGRPEIILKKEKSKKMFCCQNNCSSKPLPGCHVQKGLHKTLNNLHAYKKHVISILGALLKMWLKDFYTTFFFFSPPLPSKIYPPLLFIVPCPHFSTRCQLTVSKSMCLLKSPVGRFFSFQLAIQISGWTVQSTHILR